MDELPSTVYVTFAHIQRHFGHLLWWSGNAGGREMVELRVKLDGDWLTAKNDGKSACVLRL